MRWKTPKVYWPCLPSKCPAKDSDQREQLTRRRYCRQLQAYGKARMSMITVVCDNPELVPNGAPAETYRG